MEFTRLHPDDMAQLAKLVADELRRRPPLPDRLPARYTVEQFAHIIEAHPDTVRRYVRENHHGVRSKRLVSKDTPYKFAPGALELFGVTPDIAAARLAIVLPR